MIAYFLFGILLLVGLVLLSRWFISADPKVMARVVKTTLLTLAVLVILFLAVTRGAAALGGLIALLPFVMRWHGLWRRLKNMGGPSPGQTSEVVTDYLHMKLDHDSGELDGMVSKGGFEGRRLNEMSIKELLTLFEECREFDGKSVPVLEAYLERYYPDWREGEAFEEGEAGSNRSSRKSGSAMTRQEAYEILGLEEGAGEEAVREAHHRLMVRIHPDQGGSNWLAARINEARDTLLGL
ncbi:MAG: molecular chaperone DnaJ [Rhodospirillaceae bacterium]|nr:molecular chaperone DnaJ [Rhodospirillaceae bacterium]